MIFDVFDSCKQSEENVHSRDVCCIPYNAHICSSG